ncbi:protein LURP-one-related 8 [Abrus precatorius]|uniref:Protein LURP-one-related 8 n=1 Tax=Abrus precatorius TaxID=3816 RepID=A0A8B8K0H8_ABRPR|nr:protein LURP-one-related 8 [Abrus precatorius]
MTKVYPNTADESVSIDGNRDAVAVVLTVWKKSLLLNCNGFTVLDGQGNLVFRVDNYIAGNKDEILLMDAAGTPLLTIRRKRLSLGDTWLIFEGEDSVKLLFTARKHVNNKCLAHLLRSANEDASWRSKIGNKKKEIAYEIEGSYMQRCCTFYDNNRRKVAEIKRKEAVSGGVAFGADIFRLIVQPHMDPTLAMAFVILLDHMFGSRSLIRPHPHPHHHHLFNFCHHFLNNFIG